MLRNQIKKTSRKLAFSIPVPIIILIICIATLVFTHNGRAQSQEYDCADGSVICVYLPVITRNYQESLFNFDIGIQPPSQVITQGQSVDYTSCGYAD